MDRRGCGLSGGDRGHAASWKTLIADVAALLSEIEKRRLGVAIHLLGISLGATVGLGTSLFHPGRIRSQILLSPGLKSAVRLPLLRRLRLLRRSVVEPTKLYELPFTLDQVTDRAQWQEAYRQDCLRTSRVSARFLVEVFRMQRFIRRRVCRIDAPIYALLAGKDLIVDNVATLEALSRAQSARVEIFKGAFHNLTVALPRHELAMRLTTWMLNEASERPPGVRVASVEGTFPEETLPSPIVESQFPLR
jgi:alpha-beta hydrolase superfamily lysophospholipase